LTSVKPGRTLKQKLLRRSRLLLQGRQSNGTAAFEFRNNRDGGTAATTAAGTAKLFDPMSVALCSA